MKTENKSFNLTDEEHIRTIKITYRTIDGLIEDCSDWGYIWTLSKTYPESIRRKNYGPSTYGHTEFFYRGA